jgi:hypothetical protein
LLGLFLTVLKLALVLFSDSLTDVTESVIDRIPHPDLRDRLILLRGTFTFFAYACIVFVLNIRPIGRVNLVDCLHDFASSVTIHGDEVLAHANWEIGETWLRRYGFVDSSYLFVSRYADPITHRRSQFGFVLQIPG